VPAAQAADEQAGAQPESIQAGARAGEEAGFCMACFSGRYPVRIPERFCKGSFSEGAHPVFLDDAGDSGADSGDDGSDGGDGGRPGKRG
jgi:hypothetical protein